MLGGKQWSLKGGLGWEIQNGDACWQDPPQASGGKPWAEGLFFCPFPRFPKENTFRADFVGFRRPILQMFVGKASKGVVERECLDPEPWKQMLLWVWSYQTRAHTGSLFQHQATVRNRFRPLWARSAFWPLCHVLNLKHRPSPPLSVQELTGHKPIVDKMMLEHIGLYGTCQAQRNWIFETTLQNASVHLQAAVDYMAGNWTAVLDEHKELLWLLDFWSLSSAILQTKLYGTPHIHVRMTSHCEPLWRTSNAWSNWFCCCWFAASGTLHHGSYWPTLILDGSRQLARTSNCSTLCDGFATPCARLCVTTAGREKRQRDPHAVSALLDLYCPT